MTILEKIPVVAPDPANRGVRSTGYLNIRLSLEEVERVEAAAAKRGYCGPGTYGRRDRGIGGFIRAVVLAALDEAGE